MMVQIGEKTFNIKDCKGLSSIKGLMFDNMNNKDGALIYSNKIWMPFVKHDLILIFVESDFKRIVYLLDEKEFIISSIQLAKKNQLKVYKDEDADYCIEINAKHKIEAEKGMYITII